MLDARTGEVLVRQPKVHPFNFSPEDLELWGLADRMTGPIDGSTHPAGPVRRPSANSRTPNAQTSSRDSSRSRSRSTRRMTSKEIVPSFRICTIAARWASITSCIRRW